MTTLISTDICDKISGCGGDNMCEKKKHKMRQKKKVFARLSKRCRRIFHANKNSFEFIINSNKI